LGGSEFTISPMRRHDSTHSSLGFPVQSSLRRVHFDASFIHYFSQRNYKPQSFQNNQIFRKRLRILSKQRYETMDSTIQFSEWMFQSEAEQKRENHLDYGCDSHERPQRHPKQHSDDFLCANKGRTTGTISTAKATFNLAKPSPQEDKLADSDATLPNDDDSHLWNRNEWFDEDDDTVDSSKDDDLPSLDLTMSESSASLSEDSSVDSIDKDDSYRQLFPTQRNVHFSPTILVREYELAVGDHPFCDGRLPLTLDWKHTAWYHKNLEHSKSRGPCYVPPRRLSFHDRRQRLMHVSGYTANELKELVLLHRDATEETPTLGADIRLLFGFLNRSLSLFSSSQASISNEMENERDDDDEEEVWEVPEKEASGTDWDDRIGAEPLEPL
jgi:hypothetical protein